MTYTERKRRKLKLVDIALQTEGRCYRTEIRRVLDVMKKDGYGPDGYLVQLNRALNIVTRALEADKSLGDW